MEPESIRLRTVSNRGGAPGFFFGAGPNTVSRISVNTIWESTHSPPGMSHRGGGGGWYFPKLPKRVCAAQQGRDFRTLSFTAKLGPWSQPRDKNVQNVLFR